MKRSNKYIEFEVTTRINPFMLFGGGGTVDSAPSSNSNDDGEFKEITEDDLNILANALGG